MSGRFDQLRRDREPRGASSPPARSRPRSTGSPSPPRQPRHFTLISVDDHLVEPPDMFEGRVPAKFADRRAAGRDRGRRRMEYWLYDGQRHYKVGLNAVVGKPLQRASASSRPASTRCAAGAYDIHARVHDMDLNGVYASLSFPSSLAGFAGPALPARRERSRSSRSPSCAPPTTGSSRRGPGTYPGRIIPLQLPWLLDPEEGAAEIRANAARGFQAVTFPELPERLGLPSLHTGYWDPFMAACAETGTVVCLHVGLVVERRRPRRSDAPSDTIGVLFFGWAMFAAVDWLYSQAPGALPRPQDLPVRGRHRLGAPGCSTASTTSVATRQIFGTWDGIDLTPREVMQRNFWFCTIDDLAGLEQRHRIGVDHLLLESDYPHQDGTWPDTQAIVWSQIGALPGRRDRADGVAERLGAVPPPGARGACNRPRRRRVDRAVKDRPMYERDHLYIGGEWVAASRRRPRRRGEPGDGSRDRSRAPGVGARRRPRGRGGARRVRHTVPGHAPTPEDARRRARRDGRVPPRAGAPSWPSSTSTKPACRSRSRTPASWAR